MVWRGTDRARVVALAGAGSMSGATAWGGRCGGQQAGASTMHRSILPTRIISPPRVVLCRPKNTELKNTAAKAPASPLQSNTGGAGVKKGERLGE